MLNRVPPLLKAPPAFVLALLSEELPAGGVRFPFPLFWRPFLRYLLGLVPQRQVLTTCHYGEDSRDPSLISDSTPTYTLFLPLLLLYFSP